MADVDAVSSAPRLTSLAHGGGCGCKLAPSVLHEILVRMPQAGPFPDLLVGFIKAALFGLAAGIVAAYRGLNPAGGPKGVGDAVNQAVVITFILLFAINLVVTAVYLNLVPPSKF